MSRKDYRAVAGIIKKALAPDSHDHDEAEPTLLERLEVLANDMADLFAVDNERFNRAKFLTACGIK